MSGSLKDLLTEFIQFSNYIYYQVIWKYILKLSEPATMSQLFLLDNSDRHILHTQNI